MRKIYSFIMVALMAATSVCFIACDKDEDNETKEEITTPETGGDTSGEESNEGNTPEEEQPAIPDVGVADGHEYVDLGLPSGTLWATCNVGAETPADYGDYFAWGETEPKEVYNWSTYKYGSDWDELTKYCTDRWYGIVDNKTVLDPSDDAATVNWGSDWCMPTKAQQDELIEYCTWTLTTLNSVNGLLVVASNGNSIFLPAAGYRIDSGLYRDGSWGEYWSSSLFSGSPNSVGYFSFDSNSVHWYDGERYLGYSVRPVRVSDK